MSTWFAGLSARCTRIAARLGSPVRRLLSSLLLIPDQEPLEHAFSAHDRGQLQRLTRAPGAAAIDDATWKDLLLDAYASALSDQLSIFGQQVLHRRLRAGIDGEDRAVSQRRVRALMADPARLRQLEGACKHLRHADTEIATLLYDSVAPPIAWWAGKTWPLPVLLLASIAAVIWSPLAWLATFAILYVLMSRQMQYASRVSAWQRAMHSLQMLLKTSSLLGAQAAQGQGAQDAADALAPFAQHAAQAGRLNRSLSRSLMSGMLPGSREYLDWFKLENINHYFKGIAIVYGQLATLPFLRACLLRAGDLEADLALARHLLAAPGFCWPSRSEAGMLALEQAVHPLLPGAQALDIDFGGPGSEGKGAFISGQNGIGKSTLLRTVGLNLVAARAFGFCYARRASVPQVPVYASMQSEDSMAGGESLYLAELRRARELLAAAEGPHPGIYLIDEIFRGTNHLESVSAAAAVLDVLAASALVIVSSHNLVLAPLLAHRLAPWCVRLDQDGRLLLAPGVLAHTNGIALLAQRGFGAQVEANAGKVFTWLSAYLTQPLAQPADGSGVLA